MVKAIFVNPIARKRLNAHSVILAEEVLLASRRRRGEAHRDLGSLTSRCRGVAASWLPTIAYCVSCYIAPNGRMK
jgi:hypothetical protein